MAYAPPRVNRRAAQVRRRRLALAAAGVVLGIVVIVALTSGSGRPRLPLPGVGRPPKAGDPFAYVSSRQGDFEARAVAGSAHDLVQYRNYCLFLAGYAVLFGLVAYATFEAVFDD